MSNVWGENIKLSIFGESHGAAVGIVIDGLPPGEKIDMEILRKEMLRRAPGRNEVSTARKETDEVKIISGMLDGKTTGAPVCGIIENSDTRPNDYQPTILRPGHADWTAYLKYKGFADMRGGGHFSGRLTAPLVFAGGMAKQILARRGVYIGAHIIRIGTLEDKSSFELTPEFFKSLAGKAFPVINDSVGEQMKSLILKQKECGDSVGGIVEAAVIGVPGGLGNPFFGSMESSIASMLFSVPAVKGIEFGDGFELAQMCGSEANDLLELNDKITAISNRNGGILGGITNGMPIIVRAVFKPTPSIAKEQKTVDVAAMKNTVTTVKGRHDPCIVQRAVPVVEAALALCILDKSKDVGI